MEGKGDEKQGSFSFPSSSYSELLYQELVGNKDGLVEAMLCELLIIVFYLHFIYFIFRV